MVTAAALYALQETDLATDGRRGRLADIEAQLGETEELISSRQAVEEARTELERRRERQREIQWQVDEVRDKAGAIEKKLYGGSVRNPKELEDLQLDLEALRRQVSAREDGLLERMLEVEEVQEKFSRGERDLADISQRWKEEQAALQAEKSQLESELGELEQKRARQTDGLDQGILGLYDALRSRRQGRAVAKVERGMCQGCRITLPISFLQKARGGLALVQCVSCERILYVS